jgi:small ligand-binding sensory domain FIST
VFTCNGRGSHLFGRPGPDAEALADGLETTVLGGMFCAGELGPIGGRHFLHGFTASALLLGAESAN